MDKGGQSKASGGKWWMEGMPQLSSNGTAKVAPQRIFLSKPSNDTTVGQDKVEERENNTPTNVGEKRPSLKEIEKKNSKDLN